MISEILGIMALLFIALCVLLFAHRWPAVAKILWLAFAVRTTATLFHYYLLPLPDSSIDARTFELVAWKWAQEGFGAVLTNFTGPSPYFISWILALIYSVTERSPLLAQSMSVFMGMGTVLIGLVLIRDIWDERIATKAGWGLAFFPTFVLYSAITLREAYIGFFLVIGLLGAVGWTRSGGIKPILLATFGFVGATFFHGAMFVGLLSFSIIVFLRALKKILLGFTQAKVRISDITVVLLAMIPIGGFLLDEISLPYIGDFSHASSIEILLSKIQKYSISTGNGAYPGWLLPNSLFELLYKGPIRIAYFMFSPFPWDVKMISHLIGVLDSLVYSALAYLLWINRKIIWACPERRILLMILLSYLLVFGLAVGNFGTGIRHRAKFALIMITLAAPFLPKVCLRNLSITFKN